MRLQWMKRNSLAVLVIGLAAGLAQAGELTVSAAASLTNAFKEIAQDYEAQHAGTKVLLNFGASGALLQQMAKGAPVDVFATADQETMDEAGRQGLLAAGERQDFVRNTLVVIVPVDSKLALGGLSDLQQPDVARIAVANPASVPVGRYAKGALDKAGLWSAIEAKAVGTQNVRQSLDYVTRGEVDAGFVYATDAAVMKEKVRVAFEVRVDTPILYPIARTAGGANAEEAGSFVAHVLSPAGQAVLSKHGFQKP
ncbi:molybdate ABC transporter substrate-binding protein [Thauera sp.]|uniref:molybdate ABC transporter substrate-binding protein n=1 Tax=Thauera sp. TaxID=1905334 RepID=UPI002CE1A4B7|nr:molybdate ABC transporter substrate-binding protein [Thauera sp.]HRO36911.1 molybdate ABC transporter substrate-binding protein [Thauera sp.]